MRRLFWGVLITGIITAMLIGAGLTGGRTYVAKANTPRLVENDDGTRTLVYVDTSGTMNSVLDFDFSDDEYLVMIGKHNASSSDWHYFTKAYYFTDKSTGRSISTYKGSKRRLERVNIEPDAYENGKWKTKYYIRWSEILEAAREMFSEEELFDTVTLYMSNVFEVRKRSNGDRQYGNDVIDYGVMINRDSAHRSLPMGIQWSDTTLRILPAYYDIPIVIEKLYSKVYELKTNCSKCAISYAKQGFKEEGMEYCKQHKKGDVWFSVAVEVLSNFGPDKDTTMWATREITGERGKDWKLSEKGSCFMYVTPSDRDGLDVSGKVDQGASGGSTKLELKASGNGWYRVYVTRGKYIDGLTILQYEEKVSEHKVNVRYVLENGNLVYDAGSTAIKVGDTYTYTLPAGHEKYNGFRYLGKAEYVYGNSPKGGSKGTVAIKGKKHTIKHEKDEDGTLLILFENMSGGGHETSESSEKKVSFMDSRAKASITSGVYDTCQSIPVTEKALTTVNSARYLFDGEFDTKKGTKTYAISVSLPYSLTYKGPSYYELNEETGEYEEREGPDISVSGSTQGIIYVNRDYSYTQISKLAVYEPLSGVVKSRCFEGGSITINQKLKSHVRAVVNTFPAGDSGHIKDPSGINNTVTLPTYTYTTSSTVMPSVPAIGENYRSYAEAAVGQINCRNDSLIFCGRTVLDSSYREREASAPVYSSIKEADIIGAGEMQREDTIPSSCKNGVCESSGSITYTLIASAGRKSDQTITQRIDGINNVVIHTPVYCEGVIESDNLKYVQSYDVDTSCKQLVNGRASEAWDEGHENDSCDFYVSVNCAGNHVNLPGYGYRDYMYNSMAEQAAYIMSEAGMPLCQVRFPFEVHIDTGCDRSTANDTLIPKNTWYTLGTSKLRCYITEDVADGIYTADFRTIAVNASTKETRAQEKANYEKAYYAASDSVEIQVTGKIYGLTLTGIKDDPLWEGVSVNYSSGLKDELGISRGTSEHQVLPLVSGDNEKFKNQGVFKAGYDLSFAFKTTGSRLRSKSTYVEVTPRFYHVDSDGGNRREVELYYNDKVLGKINRLIRVGSSLDFINRKEASADEGTATFGKIIMTGMGGEWSFVYRIPRDFHVALKGTQVETKARKEGADYTEDYWIKGGYILVNMDLSCYDGEGTKLCSYINTTENVHKGCCMMWDMEGRLTSKKDCYDKRFFFEPGDVLMFYNGRSRYDDYISEKLN